MAFRKNIRSCSTRFQVKIKNSLAALPVTEMKRLRCSGLPQSYFSNLTMAALVLGLLSVTHLWKEEFSVLVQQFADSLMCLQVPPLGFHRYRYFRMANSWFPCAKWACGMESPFGWLRSAISATSPPHCRHEHCFTFIYSQNSSHFIAVFLLLDFKSHLHHFCEVSTLWRPCVTKCMP